MARHTFGDPLDDEDVLVVQGVEYPMNPVGMRAMRKLLTASQNVDKERAADQVTEQDLDLALEIVIGSVRPEVRDKFRQHIEDSVPPNLVVQIATAVMRSFSDMDPTQPESPSGGSPLTGSVSMDGAPVAELTPTL